jgi:hypothetical protein
MNRRLPSETVDKFNTENRPELLPMNRERLALEWQVSDGQETDDRAWQALSGSTSSYEHATSRSLRTTHGLLLARRWPELAGLVVLVVLLGWWMLQPTSAEVLPVEPAPARGMAASSPLATTYFLIYFHPQNAALAQAIAAQLDRRYQVLRQEFWLGPLSIENKIEIKIGFPQTVSVQLFPPHHTDTLLVIPPEFLSATGSYEAEAEVARYIENWLAGRMLDEAGERAVILPQWQAIVKAIKYVFWLRQRTDDVLRPEWVYIALLNPLPAPSAGSTAPAQPGYEAAYLDENFRNFAVTISFADYLLATYGHQRLPALLAGFGRYDSWAELSPAVFGIEEPALEAGWHTYLEQWMLDAQRTRSLPACTESVAC